MTVAEIIGIAIGCVIVACGIIICIFFAIGYDIFHTVVKRPKKHTMPNNNPFRRLMGESFNEFVKFKQEKAIAFADVKKEEISITSDDLLKLHAYFIPAVDGETKKTIICLHGYNSNPIIDFAGIAPFLRDKGYNLLLVSLRGQGCSEGKYLGLGTLDRFDVIKWTEALNERIPDGEIFLYGISTGASAAMIATGMDELPLNVKGVIEDTGFTRVWDVVDYQIKQFMNLAPFPILDIANLFCRNYAKYGWRQPNPLKSVASSSVPILFIHGGKDKFVPTYMCNAVYSACTAPKSQLIVESAGYTQSYFVDTIEYEKAVGEFLDKYSA